MYAESFLEDLPPAVSFGRYTNTVQPQVPEYADDKPAAPRPDDPRNISCPRAPGLA